MSTDECTVAKAATPSSGFESGADNSNVYESILTPSDDDTKENRLPVKGVVDLLEMLTASAMYACIHSYK